MAYYINANLADLINRVSDQRWEPPLRANIYESVDQILERYMCKPYANILEKDTDSRLYATSNVDMIRLNESMNRNNNKQTGDFHMPKIENYKYIADHGVTIIEWSDKTTTKVVHDPKSADQFTGFAVAVAKKAMGNKGKFLGEWDRLVTEPIEAAKKAEEEAKKKAEQEAAEVKIHAEAKAKRDAKKAERKRQRKIDEIAREFAEEYYDSDLELEAAQIAMKKYGVPASWFNESD